MRKDKGRSPSEELVPIVAAARMLRLSVRTLHRMCVNGVLHPVYKTGNGAKYFPVAEIAALAEIVGKKLDLDDVAVLAMRALVTAKANERRFEDLLRSLGLKRRVLGTTADEVAMLYEQALHALEVPRQPTIDELEDWSGAFYAIDEAYLALVEKATASPEPWKVFLDLANLMAKERPFAFYESVPTLRSAYDYLEAARRNLRIVSFMYCRERHGISTADKLFGKGDLPDQILSVMFSS